VARANILIMTPDPQLAQANETIERLKEKVNAAALLLNQVVPSQDSMRGRDYGGFITNRNKWFVEGLPFEFSKEQLDRLRSGISKDAEETIERLTKERDIDHQLREDFEKLLKELEAAAGGMRSEIMIALTQLRESFSGRGLKEYMNFQFPATVGHIPFNQFCSDVDAAFKTLFDCQLSRDCGKAFLARMEEAEWLLENCRYEENREWFERCQKWLEGNAT
jgi:hypothetical protein